jgi:S1-C subfamily serine protease
VTVALALSVASSPGRVQAGIAAEELDTAAKAAAAAVVRIEIVRDGERTSTASGLAIDTLGNVVTGADAIAGARVLRVVLADRRALPARLLGADPHSGVAVVQLERPPRDLAVARFADSDLVEVGERIVTIARRSDGAPSIASGLVNARRREPRATPISAVMGGRESFSTDVPFDAANPGGALVNRDGEVVALAVGAQGLPINRVRRVAQMILARGEARYPYIGVLMIDVRDLDAGDRARLGEVPPAEGAVVSRVVVGAPAARAGLRPGDVITAVDHLETRAADEVLARVSDHDVGERVTIGYVRAGEPRSVQVGVDALPSPLPSPSPFSARVRTSWVISAGAPSRIGGPQ